MDVKTTYGIDLDSKALSKYFSNLVNMFYKILPMQEEKEPTITVYMESLLNELLGCKSLIKDIGGDPAFTSLIFILQYLIEHIGIDHSKIRREVFRAINICNKLAKKYEK